MLEDVSIIQAKPEDAGLAIDFYYKLIDDMQGTPYCPKWTKGLYPILEDMNSAAEKGNLFLAEDQSLVIGSFILNHVQPAAYSEVPWSYSASPEETAVLHLLASAPQVQGKGLGRKLLEKAVQICRTRRDKVLRLDTTLFDVPAHKLYESFGFHYCGDVEIYYPTTGKVPFRMYEYRVC